MTQARLRRGARQQRAGCGRVHRRVRGPVRRPVRDRGSAGAVHRRADGRQPARHRGARELHAAGRFRRQPSGPHGGAIRGPARADGRRRGADRGARRAVLRGRRTGRARRWRSTLLHRRLCWSTSTGESSAPTRSGCGSRTPGSSCTRRACSGSAPERCAVVEDSDYGIAAGVAAGMQVFALVSEERAGSMPDGVVAVDVARGRCASRSRRRAAVPC